MAVWFDKEKEANIAEEDWDPLYDAEYMRKAIKGWGKQLFYHTPKWNFELGAGFCTTKTGLKVVSPCKFWSPNCILN